MKLSPTEVVHDYLYERLSLIALAKRYKVSRQRIDQILRAEGLTEIMSERKAEDAVKRAEGKAARLLAEKEAKLLRKIVKFGGDPTAIPMSAREAFRSQRCNAQRRGIQWTLSLVDWWEIWQASGKYKQRGKLHDQYVLTRHDFDRGFVPDNVCVTTFSKAAQAAIRDTIKKGKMSWIRQPALLLEVDTVMKARG